jgi:hypothetical protein
MKVAQSVFVHAIRVVDAQQALQFFVGKFSLSHNPHVHKTEQILLPAVKRAASVVLSALLLCVLLGLSGWYFFLNNVAVYRSISLGPK